MSEAAGHGPSGSDNGVGGRRRRSGRRRRRSRRSFHTPQGPLGISQFGNAIFAAMVLLALAQMFAVWSNLSAAASSYDGVAVGMRMAEVHYLLGEPRQRNAEGRVWTYRDEARETRVGFDNTGAVEWITCADDDSATVRCPEVLGIETGSDEEAVIRRFGAPARIALDEGKKVLAYPALALELELRQTRVDEIVHRGRADRWALRGEWLRNLLP